MGFMLEPWRESKKRKAIATGKFYFFDPGVVNFLAGIRVVDRHSNHFGNYFETLIGHELRAYLSYSRTFDDLTFWRTDTGFEVDYLVGNHTAIEVKSKSHVTKDDLKGLMALGEEGVFKHFIMVSHDEVEKNDSGIHIIHWSTFLKRLWEKGLGE